ncbi:nuclear transport factor 2 family protein [Solirubrobacter sp. CPCC 204708]|uniref:Nuclear transport factor 2 family protein n=1 Tax=Solirubrobacter deserti TaxID=2282478 RepID=A0ABT4RJJ2_9ACTN|nr:nuclear transport factor 2 family protein [Solirubrobacter deserti]MBE2319792.1 nuclear transport factor 2 family protein [Solirubrobacter deserti]MDA0138724.1 nuclear transport factor 2 family protein [Solirubrobacter deserti]
MSAADRQELAGLEEEWMSAMQSRDMDRLEALVADGFRFTAVHLNDEPMSREQWMDAARDGYMITSFAFERMEIDVFGDTAVIHSRFSQVASWEQNNLSNVFRLTDVWSRGTNGWQVVARHSSTLG